MKYKTLHHTAKQIDHLIDNYLHSNKTAFIPQDELKELILKNFPDLYLKNFGWHKIVFGIRSTDQKVVIKVGTQKSIENDHRAYKRVPESKRHQLFAKIFGHSKYCLVQEYGFPADVSQEELADIRKIVYRYGVFDVKAENLMCIDGQLKIIDVNVAPFPLPTVWRMVDEVKPKLPKRLMRLLKKTTRMLTDR